MHVLVIQGDRQSPEYDISMVTGNAIFAALQRIEGITASQLEVAAITGSACFSQIIQLHRQKPIDLIINGFLGGAGENGEFPRQLDGMGIPYTHSGAAAAALGMDKVAFKQAFHRACVEQDVEFPSLRLPLTRTYEQVLDNLNSDTPYYHVAKPNANGSSIGVTLIESVEQLQLLPDPHGLIYEPYIEGLEVTCGVVGTGPNARALPVTAIVKPQAQMLLDYDAKYVNNSVRHVTPATLEGLLSQEVHNEIARISYFAHTHFGFRTVSRCDFIVDSYGRIHLLEINSNPGCTPKSFIPEQAAAVGLDFQQLIGFFVEDARIYWSNKKCA